MGTHSSILTWRIPWNPRGAWRATVHGGHNRVGHNLVTKQQKQSGQLCRVACSPLNPSTQDTDPNQPEGPRCPWEPTHEIWLSPSREKDFPGGSDGKASVHNAGDLGSIPGSGRFPGEGRSACGTSLPGGPEAAGLSGVKEREPLLQGNKQQPSGT